MGKAAKHHIDVFVQQHFYPEAGPVYAGSIWTGSESAAPLRGGNLNRSNELST
jgi:hypothetical protein